MDDMQVLTKVPTTQMLHAGASPKQPKNRQGIQNAFNLPVLIVAVPLPTPVPSLLVVEDGVERGAGQPLALSLPLLYFLAF